MHRSLAWAEWDIFRGLLVLLCGLQVFVLGFLGIWGAEGLFLSREPVLLELREDHNVTTAQEFIVFLRQLSPVLHVTYRTREQQLLTMQTLFPDGYSSKSAAMPFHDVLVVHLRGAQGYRSLFGALMAEPKWQKLLSPPALLRAGEQIQKISAIWRVLRFFQGCFLVAILGISCAFFLFLTKRVQRSLGPLEEHSVLQGYLGAASSRVLGAVAGRLAAIACLGTLLSLLVIFLVMVAVQARGLFVFSLLFSPLYPIWLAILLLEGVIAILFSCGSVTIEHAVRPFLRRSRPTHC